MSLLTLPICKSRKFSNSYWCDWGGDVSLVQMSVFGLIFGVLCNDTLPPYPEEESGHCSPRTPGNAGQGVFFLCMGPAGAPVFVSERQTLLSPVSPSLRVAASVMSTWASCGSWPLPRFPCAEDLLPAGRLCVQMDRCVCVLHRYTLTFLMSSLKCCVFRELSLATLNGIAVPSPTLFLLLPQSTCYLHHALSAYFFCLLTCS